MSAADVIGALGVALLLGAFAANLMEFVRKDSWVYPATNLVGATLAAYASWLISYMPFLVLEGVWAGVSLVALCRLAAGARAQQKKRLHAFSSGFWNVICFNPNSVRVFEKK